MRKFLLLLFAIPFLSNVQAQNAKIVISAVFDADLSGGLPKGIELYVRENIADLSNFGVGSANNGGGTDGEEFTFPAVAASAGQHIYIASESPQFTNWFGFAPDYTSNSMAINGDDAIELFEGGSVIDTYGDINTDGNGEIWEYVDGFAYRTNIPANGTGPFVPGDWSFNNGAFEDATSNATSSPSMPIGTLPVEFIKFTAQKFNSENVLSWATATEVNNEKFMVERSTDGVRFYDLGSVSGQGTSSEINEYSFVDYSPIAGLNYYRLKQMDFDGNYDYSSIITIDNRVGETIKVYPTTLSDYLTIEANENADVKIFSVTGKLVLNQTMNNTKTVINLGELATGSYFVAITNGSETVTKQVIKK